MKLLTEQRINEIIQQVIEDRMWQILHPGQPDPDELRAARFAALEKQQQQQPTVMPNRRFNITNMRRPTIAQPQTREVGGTLFDGRPHSYTVNIFDTSVDPNKEFSDTFDNITNHSELDAAIRSKYPRLAHWNRPRKCDNIYAR